MDRFMDNAGSDLIHEIVNMLPTDDKIVLRSVNSRWRKQIAPDLEDVPKSRDVGAFGNSLARAQWILSQNLNVKEKGIELMIGAAEVGCLDVLDWLWDIKGKPIMSEILKSKFDAVACAAVFHGRLDVLEWLVETKKYDATKWSIMYSAARGGNIATVKRLRNLGATFNRCTFIIGAAAAGGHAALVDWLIAEGAKISHTLMVDAMARNGHLEMLAAHVAKVNAGEFDVPENDGYALVSTKMVLDFAASTGKLHVIEWLQTLPHPFPLKSSNALATAMEGGHAHVVSWLHNRGCR
jgi:hypothetical protein